jgi:hypothetical protein
MPTLSWDWDLLIRDAATEFLEGRKDISTQTPNSAKWACSGQGFPPQRISGPPFRLAIDSCVSEKGVVSQLLQKTAPNKPVFTARKVTLFPLPL